MTKNVWSYFGYCLIADVGLDYWRLATLFAQILVLLQQQLR